tara:strand:+ start:146 stop:724 length:579 start_codon:yes stop_codon:yes gene_type:complete
MMDATDILNNFIIEEKKKIYLICGPSGCGKSTKAKQLSNIIPDVKHFENDNHCIDENGMYKFDSTKVDENRLKTQDQVRFSMLKNDIIIVSNTFTNLEELEPYYKLAFENNYEVIQIYPEDISSEENPIWINNNFNVDLILSRRMNKDKTGKVLPEAVIRHQIEQYNKNSIEIKLTESKYKKCRIQNGRNLV